MDAKAAKKPLLLSPAPTNDEKRLEQHPIRQFFSSLLGIVIEEMDFRLSPDTVRNPDVAFITREHLQSIDLDRSPVDGAPALVVEVISPSNSAQDMAKKTQQYLMSGCRTVWIVYPSLRVVEIYSPSGTRQVREPELLQAEDLLPGFSLSLGYILDTPKS
jgi:Uma2 family endonuclease